MAKTPQAATMATMPRVPFTGALIALSGCLRDITVTQARTLVFPVSLEELWAAAVEFLGGLLH
jgi:hypothetical protein